MTSINYRTLLPQNHGTVTSLKCNSGHKTCFWLKRRKFVKMSTINANEKKVTGL